MSLDPRSDHQPNGCGCRGHQEIVPVARKLGNPIETVPPAIRRIAFAVAVEDYTDSRISKVDFANADATAWAEALSALGFHQPDQVLLLGDRATKALVESQLEAIIDGLQEEDVLYVFFAGHGFSKNGQNYVTCRDTNLDALERTSIKVDTFFEWFKSSLGRRLVLFLDCCESGVLADSKYRGIYADLTENELRDFFSNSEHRVCFAACKPNQKSYPSAKFGHGIWTYHVIQALRGNPAALQDGLLTSSSLQNYLKIVVPETVRTHLTGVKQQNPWMYGSSDGDFLVADLRKIVGAKPPIDPSVEQLAAVELYGTYSEPVRNLSGFQTRRHTVPSEVNEFTQAFAVRISEEEFEERLNQTIADLKKAYKFTRKDVTVTEGDGGATIVCPYFDVSLSRRLDESDPSDLLTEIRVLNIRDPQKLMENEFTQVFGDSFDAIEVTVPRAIKIAELVDYIEGLGNQAIILKYNDRSLDWCTIRTEGTMGYFSVSHRTVTFVGNSCDSTEALIQQLFAAQRRLAELDPSLRVALTIGAMPQQCGAPSVQPEEKPLELPPGKT